MNARLFHAAYFALCIGATLLTGCASVDYKPHSPAPPPRPANYPVAMYNEEMRIPRPCTVIGTVSITPGKYTMFGGSMASELKKVLRMAHEKGADVIQIKSMEKPGFVNPNFRITVDLLRYADVWETIPMTKAEFQDYLETNRAHLDPIEGVWHGDLPQEHYIAIMRNHAVPGREFVGFILDDPNPVWKPGTRKIDIRPGLESGSYLLTYYLDDFAPKAISIILADQRYFRFDLPKDEQDYFITYFKLDARF